MLKRFLLIICILSFWGGSHVFAMPQSIPTEAKLEYNKGIDYYNSGQFDNAINAFRKAIEIEPNYIDAYYNLAMTFDYLRQYEASLSVFTELIKRQPDDYGAIYRAAQVSQKLNENEKVKHFLSLIPSDSPFYYKAEEIAQQLGTSMEKLRDYVPKDISAADVKKIQENDANANNSAESNKPIAKNSKFSGNFYYEDIPSPTGIVTDKTGNLYVADYSDNVVFKITPTGEKMVYLKNPKIKGPIGLAMDDGGNLYIANYDGNNVLKLSSSHQLTTLIENVEKPYYLYVNDNMLFVSSQGVNGVIRYKLK